MQDQILIVGAGPTGLALALFLAKQGVKARIIDKNAGPGEASRAMAVQARTLEFYQQIGIAEEVVNAGFKQESVRLRSGGRERARFNFSNMGKGLSPFPYVLSYPQDDHEKLLGKFLKSSGIQIEWNTTLLDLKEDADTVKARIATNVGEEEVQVGFLCGCDGTHSTVRESLGLKFPGGTYEQMLYVADVQASGQVPPDNEIGGFLDSSGFCLVFSIRSSGHYRLIGLIPKELLGKPQLSFQDIKTFAERTTGVRVEKTFWSSVYHSHHRVVEHFRVGRVFIAGDAGHVHSPVGGQGMNTGIGDAVNLAWKLASVLQGHADQSILDSYEPERITFARALVNTTDRFFNFVTGPGLRAKIFRDLVFKRVVPLLLRSQGVRRRAFRIISQ